MKAYAIHLIAIAGVFSLNSFGQVNEVITNADIRKAPLKFDDKSDEDLVIESYCVEEVINLAVGKKRITTYEVSKLDMVNTYDLGPNNTRTVTAIYRKAHVKATEPVASSKIITVKTDKTIQPINIKTTVPAYSKDSISINVLNIYTNVVDKGYKSADMLKKVADKFYFENDFEAAAKYYSELFSLEENSEPVYYLRCAKSLKAINQPEKAEEMIKLFESKNTALAMSKK
ncbi:hypothetical protein [Flavobacterium chungangense]|uniref:Tetratricopeptide repeat protein n=1 Tax=Flavobacterium chungangense TaxID=554283 RepID=A0A6V6YPD4_9FLAO|nr:hypothetical protein [Flavobacterium chungangense]CAD0001239.1 hypothetical protein FLACHUCJ7_00423 [Flavobacterium chungangense]